MFRRFLDTLSGGLARALLAIFYRSIEVDGIERVPRQGPLVVVANHPNGLVDPALLLAALPRPIRFLGKSTLWKIPPLRPFLALAGVIPVYRRSDPGVDPSKNAETFARCREALVAGEAISLFPEGMSHGEPSLQELRTGAARIALDAAAALGAGAGSVAILPVGLAFDRRERFRSRALVAVGTPFSVEAALGEVPAAGAEEREAVRRLTGRIAAALGEVTASYRSWREARLFLRAAEIYGRRRATLPAARPLAEVHRLSLRLTEGVRRLREIAPARVEEVARRTARYDRALGRLGLVDAQVAAHYPWREVVPWVAATLLLGLVALPVAGLGIVLGVLPYRVTGMVARHSGKTVDQIATWKLFGALFLYPACWGLEALAIGWVWGTEAAVAALVLAPLAGYVALRVMERSRRLLREARAQLVLRRRPHLGRRLRALRASILEEMDALTLDLGLERPAAPTAS